MIQPGIWTTAKFSRMIEKLSVELNANIMDTVVHYCDRNKMEVESAAKLCNAKLKRQMFAEASNINMVTDDDPDYRYSQSLS